MVREKNVKSKKNKKNRRGFTLIELLAVIIILGVLLIIAVPAISRYIEDSRRSTYINSVKSIVNAISTSVNNLDYPVPSKNEAIIIPFSEAELEKGTSKTKSPFAPYEEGKNYVIVTFDGVTYHYYVAALDQAGFSIPLIDVKDLTESSITTNTNTISNNVYSIEDIKKGNVLDTYQFAMKYKSKAGDVYKVQIGETVYNRGSVVQLKDGSKWYVLPVLNEDGAIVSDTMENKKINLVSYNHMETDEYRIGLQSSSKTEPYIVFDRNGVFKYAEAEIYDKSQQIITSTYVKLTSKGLNTTGVTVDMPTVVDFCGKNYVHYICSSSLSYLSGNGGFWTKDYSGSYVLAINNGTLSSTSPHYGSLQADTSGYGIRVVIRNLLKSNIDKDATKKLR